MHYITTLNLVVNNTKTEKKMSDNDLEKIRLKKAEMLIKAQSMPTEIVKIHSAEEFNKLTQDFSDKVIIIDFWAVWCSPCMMFAPIFEKIQKERYQDFIFVKVNVDEVGSIAQNYRITGIPTTLFIKDNKVIHKIVGAVNEDYMNRILEKLKSFA
ncbi:MAG: thioredoxin [Promethearchaeota archaeon Loki_b31]|nr:MAG: thioredoxin [Candidatus Lokiarchaeota archaeon Loki_b31]